MGPVEEPAARRELAVGAAPSRDSGALPQGSDTLSVDLGGFRV